MRRPEARDILDDALSSVAQRRCPNVSYRLGYCTCFRKVCGTYGGLHRRRNLYSLRRVCPAAAMKTAIKAKCIVDGNGQAPIEDGIVLVEGDTIEDIGTERSVHVPTDAEVVALPGDETLLPGLVDSHPSLCWYLKNFLLLMEDPYEILFLRALRNLRINLRSGVTSIRCLAEKGFVDILYRQAVEEGLVLGPRIKTCTRGFRMQRGHGFLGTPVNSIEELRQGLKENVDAGADFLKFFATGAVLIDGQVPSFMTQEEIRATVNAGHQLGKRVTVHAVGGQGLHDCLNAGVDCVEHGYFIDEEAIAKLKADDRWLVITSGILFDDEALSNLHSRELQEAHASQRPIVRESLSKAVEAGLNVAVGTDGLVGKLAQEVRFLTEIGLTHLEAIRAATLQGARLMDADREIGSLQVGKRADIISVAGNPLEDISALSDVRLVMKNGWRLDPVLDEHLVSERA
jgi:imidazolonepropionase-like amidohydrolase